MSEFFAPPPQEDREEFEEAILNASDQTAIDKIIKNKAHDILTEFSAQEILKELNIERQQEVKDRIEDIINPSIKFEIEFDSNKPYITINELKTDIPDLDKRELIYLILTKINEELSNFPEKIQSIERAAKYLKDGEAKTKLLTLQNELVLLKQQLEYRLNNKIELEGVSIEEAVSQYRKYKAKFEKLSENSLEREDIEEILEIYTAYIKEEFEKTPEKYAQGLAKAIPLDIETFISLFQFTDLEQDTKYHQRNITETRPEIISNLVKTPGIVATISLPPDSIGTRNADVIAFTLKAEVEKILSPFEIEQALNIFLSKLHQAVNEKEEVDNIDKSDIVFYGKGKTYDTPIDNIEQNTKLEDIFNFHFIKIQKRTSEFTPIDSIARATARPTTNWNDPNNIAEISNTYFNTKDNITSPLNETLFQLSAQNALGIKLG